LDYSAAGQLKDCNPTAKTTNNMIFTLSRCGRDTFLEWKPTVTIFPFYSIREGLNSVNVGIHLFVLANVKGLASLILFHDPSGICLCGRSDIRSNSGASKI
jgi:hypothetical protein